MRVLLVGNTWPDACERAVRDLGHDVVSVNYRAEPHYVWTPDATGLPPTILRHRDRGAGEWRPEVVVLQQGDYRDGWCIPVSWVRAQQDHGACVVWWTYDYSAAQKRTLYADLALACNEILVCCEEDRAWFRARHSNVRLDYLGIDPAFWHPVDLTAPERQCYHSEVLLSGHLYPSRQYAIDCLRANGVNVETYGGAGQLLLDANRIRYAYQAAGVNVVVPYVHDGKPDPWYLFSRCFEIPACGGYMIAKRNAAFEWWLPEVPLFDTYAKMLELVLAGPDAEARAVSVKLTRRRVLQRFTLARFFGRILKGCQEAAHAD